MTCLDGRMRFPLEPFIAAILAGIPAFFLSGCAGDFAQSPTLALYEAKPLRIESGKASYYGGRWKADGER